MLAIYQAASIWLLIFVPKWNIRARFMSKNVLSAALSKPLKAMGWVAEDGSPRTPLLRFTDSILRGIGQVMLQNNSVTGLIFLFGVFYSSMLFGWAVLLGTVASTATAMLLGVDRVLVKQGLFGFNGALVAIGLLYFLEPNALTWVYVVFAAACSTVLMAALLNFLNTWKVPVLTAPFVLTTMFFILATARFGRLHSTDLLPTAGLPKAAVVEGVVSVTTVVEGLFNGVAQVFFQSSTITGVIFVIGLLFNSRLAFTAALLGSLVGLLVAWGMGASEPAIRSGAFGFNSVLTALVFVSGFVLLNAASAIYGLFATIAAAIVFAAMSAALEPIGMPAMTAPFILVCWVFLLASPIFGKIKPANN